MKQHLYSGKTIIWFTIFFFLSSFILAQSDCKVCQDELAKMYISTTVLIDKVDSLEGQLAKVQQLYTKALEQLEGLENPETPFPLEPESPNPDLQRQIDELQRRIRVLQRQLDQLKQEKRDLQNTIATLKGEINSLKITITDLRNELKQIKESFQVLNDIVTCLYDFQDRYKQKELDHRKKIQQANKAYEFFDRHRFDDKIKEEVKEDTILFAWNIYQTFGASINIFNCGKFYFEDQPDYMNAREHYYAAKILALNDGTNIKVLNLLADNPKDRLNIMTKLLLIEVGKAYEGNYDNISDNSALMENIPKMVQQLPFLLMPERKGSDTSNQQNSTAQSGNNTEAVSNIRKIFSSYNSKDYSTALNLFNKYYRVFDMDGIKENKTAILNAKFAVGSILLWNLGNINKNKGLMVEGSWLYENIHDQNDLGAGLLKQYINAAPPSYLKSKAVIILKKYYKPKTKGNE